MSAGIVAQLEKAAAAVDEADLPADLRVSAFVLAFKAQSEEQNVPSDIDAASKVRSSSAHAGDLSALAARLEIPTDELERIYDVEGDTVAVIAPPRVLASTKQAAMTEVICLVVAAHQTLTGESWTPSTLIRAACENRGVLDRNYGKALKRLDGHGVRMRGQGVSREISMNAAGFEQTSEIVKALVARLG